MIERREILTNFRCPWCLSELEYNERGISCLKCDRKFSIERNILNFSGKKNLTPDGIFSSEDLISLHKEITQYKWSNGYLKFLSKIIPNKLPLFLSIIKERQVGWRFLLNLGNIQNALIFDMTIGTITEAFSFQCQQIYCLHPNQLILECIAERLSEKRIKNVHFVQDSGSKYLPFQDTLFDIILLHDINDLIPLLGLPHLDIKEKFIWLIKEITRILNPSGSVFISLPNRFGLDAFMKNLVGRPEGYLCKKVKRFFSINTVKKCLNNAGGFEAVRIMNAYPDVLNIKELFEYRFSTRKKELFFMKDDMRKLFFRSRFAPAFIAIASKNPYKSFIKNLIEQEVSNGQNLKIVKYIVSSKHTIVLAYSEEHNNGIAIRLPMTEKSYDLCRQNMKILYELVQIRDYLPFNIPTPLKEGTLHHQPFFIESIIKGMAIDRDVDIFYKAFYGAIETLTEFNRKTSFKCIFNEDLFEKNISGYLRGLKEIFENKNLFILDDIEKYLKRKFLGSKIPFVWQHGDFKLENLLIDPKTASINGIIDWELSDKEGFPLLDLFHLLASKRKVLDGKELTNVFNDIFIPCKFDKEEEKILDKYLKEIGIESDIIPAFIIMYWLHHINKRINWAPIKRHPLWHETNIMSPLKHIHSIYLI